MHATAAEQQRQGLLSRRHAETPRDGTHEVHSISRLLQWPGSGIVASHSLLKQVSCQRLTQSRVFGAPRRQPHERRTTNLFDGLVEFMA
eukprot:CAMPEP_0175869994 /NCGR_PEP_ID=MMETSP0107_2-20121207/36302_1 /TAXON_ID=195067 ORGANISM="Goniomonas pacifica, Strain CCMP1869" /NCGR_SAMPLE_ID=MMETSP0107_2 /ASSEMBLY_ACC=CAM_ASM_000203 /LENGTH=88 /DNA_ID=CAMNT_0017188151 /DNA_START=795 /DNA_END=1061 /DNA_ORIENTATION=-